MELIEELRRRLEAATKEEKYRVLVELREVSEHLEKQEASGRSQSAHALGASTT